MIFEAMFSECGSLNYYVELDYSSTVQVMTSSQTHDCVHNMLSITSNRFVSIITNWAFMRHIHSL